MQSVKWLVLSVVLVSLVMGACATAVQLDSALSPSEIRDVMQRVADWQLTHPSKHKATHWTSGALFAGLTALAQMSEDPIYEQALIGFGRKSHWQLGSRNDRSHPYHADDHAVGQMYLAMYAQTQDQSMIGPLLERFDWILANKPDVPLTHDKSEHKKRYNW